MNSITSETVIRRSSSLTLLTGLLAAITGIALFIFMWMSAPLVESVQATAEAMFQPAPEDLFPFMKIGGFLVSTLLFFCGALSSAREIQQFLKESRFNTRIRAHVLAYSMTGILVCGLGGGAAFISFAYMYTLEQQARMQNDMESHNAMRVAVYPRTTVRDCAKTLDAMEAWHVRSNLGVILKAAHWETLFLPHVQDDGTPGGAPCLATLDEVRAKQEELLPHLHREKEATGRWGMFFALGDFETYYQIMQYHITINKTDACMLEHQRNALNSREAYEACRHLREEHTASS